MRTLKDRGGGLFQNLKGFFTRKKSKPQSPKQKNKNSLVQRVKGKLKGLNKPPTSAPTQYPSTKFPMFKGNERRRGKISQNEIDQKEMNNIRFQQKTITLDILNGKPATEENKRTKSQEIVSMTLPIENVRDGMRRVFLFFYNKMRQKQGLPPSPNPVYPTNDELSELMYTMRNYKLLNYPEIMKKKMSLKEYNTYTDDLLDKTALDIFGTSLDQLNKEIIIAEAKHHVFPSLEDPDKKQFGERYGSHLGRYSPILFSSARKADHVADTMKNMCIYDVYSDTQAPILSSLDLPFCICIFGGMNHFTRVIKTIEDRNLMCSHYLIVDPKYHPFESKVDTLMTGEYIKAPNLLQTSYVIDAFKEQGINTMDEDLFQLIKKAAPTLVEASKVFLVTADKFKHLKIYDHFMVLTEKALPEGMVVTYRDPLQLAVVRRAFDESREFLLCDPYTAYCTKKKNRLLWSEAFGVKTTPTKGTYWNGNFDSYDLLRDVEKIFIDFCQYQLVISKYLDLTQNKKDSGIEDRLKKASELYKVSIQDAKFIEEMYIVGSSEALFEQFQTIQSFVKTYDRPLQTFEDVEMLIRKLNPSWRPSRNVTEPLPLALALAPPPPKSMPRGTLRLAQVLPALPPSPVSNTESLPSPTSSTPPPPPLPVLNESKEEQRARARKRIQEINTQLEKALPVYQATRRKYSFQNTNTNNVMQSRYNSIIRKPKATWSRKEIEFMKNFNKILRNFSTQQSILEQDRQQQLDLLSRLEATSV